MAIRGKSERVIQWDLINMRVMIDKAIQGELS